MRPLGDVVVDVDVQDAFEMAAVEDQQPVEAFGADGSDEAFYERGRFGRPHGEGCQNSVTGCKSVIFSGWGPSFGTPQGSKRSKSSLRIRAEI
jgi:hypothetical protein